MRKPLVLMLLLLVAVVTAVALPLRLASPPAPLTALADSGAPVTDTPEPAPTALPDHEAAAGPELTAEEEPPIPTPVPTPSVTPEPVDPRKRVGIQAGHWLNAELPERLARLRPSTGTSGGGVAEWQVNLDIAQRVAKLLEAHDIVVDVIPATVPTNYKADVFLALHADGDETGTLSGFKLARARWSLTPTVDDKIIAAIVAEYGAATGLKEDPLRVSRNMTGYYSFNWRRGEYSIAPTTPSAILEMAYMSNRSDLNLLLNKPDVIAQGIANGILRYLRETSA